MRACRSCSSSMQQQQQQQRSMTWLGQGGRAAAAGRTLQCFTQAPNVHAMYQWDRTVLGCPYIIGKDFYRRICVTISDFNSFSCTTSFSLPSGEAHIYHSPVLSSLPPALGSSSVRSRLVRPQPAWSSETPDRLRAAAHFPIEVNRTVH